MGREDKKKNNKTDLTSKARNAELAIIISYPTSTSGIIVLLKPLIFVENWTEMEIKMPPKIHAYACHIWRAWYNGSYTMATKPIKFFELHYTMTQFLINRDIKCEWSRNTTNTQPLSCSFDSSVGKTLHRRRRGRGFESRSKPEFFSGLCFSSVTATFAFDISIYSIAADGHQLLLDQSELRMKPAT